MNVVEAEAKLEGYLGVCMFCLCSPYLQVHNDKPLAKH